MATKSVVKRDYSRLISQFEVEGHRQLERINQKHQAYAEELIRFAVMVKGWRDQAMNHDNGKEGDCSKAVTKWFKQWSDENIGDKYQVHHWNTIAKAANVLSSPKVLPFLPHTKMALVHLAKKTKGDKTSDIERFTHWIASGYLKPETTVNEAKKLGTRPVKSPTPRIVEKTSVGSVARKAIANLKKRGVELGVPLNAVSRQHPNKELFTNGLSVALLTSDIDDQTGVEKLVLLTVVNNEAALNSVLNSLSF